MASTSSANTAEARELALVGKVEMRIALTDTDAKLEAILKTYLAPLLLKLASENVTVRNKVSSSHALSSSSSSSSPLSILNCIALLF
jgi:proteasome component ECM29